MVRRASLGVALVVAMLSGVAGAKVDPACATNLFNSVAGTVRNRKGVPLAGVKIQIYGTNSISPVVAETSTNALGRYSVCVNHGTYDVRAVDDPRQVYASSNKPSSTFTNLTDDIDFTLDYKLSMTVTPAAAHPGVVGPQTVTWTIRSKAPSSTQIQLRLDHLPGNIIIVTFTGTENGGPSFPGGWNVWTFADTLPVAQPERLYFAHVRGFDGATEVTESDTRAYVVDNQKPLLGPMGLSKPPQPFVSCGVANGIGTNAGPFLPVETTNPQPVITLGACDPASNGGRSGLDPFSLTGQQCDANGLACVPISPVLGSSDIIFVPPTPFPVGTYTFKFSIKDAAGNLAQSQILYKMEVKTTGGSSPLLSAPQPGNLGQGSTVGIVFGSSYTTPGSLPYVAIKATDPDGPMDLVPGSLRVRIYYGDERTLVYDYDPNVDPNSCGPPGDPVCHGGSYFQSGGGGSGFRATGFSLSLLAGRQPGRYLASATIGDHGGNYVTLTWQWILVGAV